MSSPLPPVPGPLSTDEKGRLTPPWQAWFLQLYNYLVATQAGGGGVTPITRTVNTTLPLTGGGSLGNDLSLGVNTFGSSQPGVVPSSGGGTATFLRADGTWAAAPTTPGPQGSPGVPIYLEADQGEPGELGSPGPPGPQGNPGAAGIGSQGSPGVPIFLTADPGEDGQDGRPGERGAQGSAGSQGVAGPAGPAIFLEAEMVEGDIGPPGAAGAVGATGSVGLQGVPGAVGPAVFLEAEMVEGDIGPPGVQGIQGIQGSVGSVGAQGAPGVPIFLEAPDGEAGDIGPPGPIGAVGATGSAGSQGVPGAVGPAVFLEAEMVEGDQGPPGVQGIQGTQGNAGSQGVAGPVGPAVFLEAEMVEGDQGPPGVQGLQGAAGNTGSQGLQGSPGVATFLEAETLEGDQGPPGAQGIQGAAGSNGSQGVQGPVGPAVYLEASEGEPGNDSLLGIFNAQATFANITLNGAAIPANGLYLSAANTLAFATASTQRGTVNSTGNWTVSAPSSGIALTATGLASSYTAKIIGSSTSGSSLGLLINAGTTSADNAFVIQNATASSTNLIINGVGNVGMQQTPSAWGSGYAAIQITSSLSLWSGGSGAALSSNLYYDGTNRVYLISTAFALEYAQNISSGAHVWYVAPTGTAGGTVTLTQAMSIASTGAVTISAPSSGSALTSPSNALTAVTITNAIQTPAAAATIASAATIAPTALITFVSGTVAIATITAPGAFSSGGGFLILIPTGNFTTTTVGGNIGLASTAVTGKALFMTYDKTTAKWYPSY